MDGLRLSKAEHQRLSETLHQTHDVRLYKRTLAVQECARGKAVMEVARALQVTRQSVHIGLYRYCKIRCTRTWAYSAAKCDHSTLPAPLGICLEAAKLFAGTRPAAGIKRQIRPVLRRLPKRSVVLIDD